MSLSFFNIAKFFLIFNIFVANTSLAGDVMRAGDVLEHDSYVFTIKEAEELRKRLVDLEEQNKKQSELIEEYKVLDRNLQLQITGYRELLKTKEFQIDEYKKMHELDLKRIAQFEKSSKLHKAEKWAFFGVGIGIAISAILIADKIDDSIDKSSINLANQGYNKHLIRF